MAWTTALAIYFIIWWVVLFAVLPFGAKSQADGGNVARGTDPGAPAAARLKSKLAWTTAVAAAVFATFYVIYTRRLLTLDDLMGLAGIRLH